MANETPTYDESLLEALENDPTEFSPTEFDPEADYAAPPPPLPDGWHLAKLSLIGAKISDKSSPKFGQLEEYDGPRPWGNIPATYYTQIEAVIVDPGGAQDGKRTQRFNVTTHGEKRRNGTSAANLVYRAITGQPLPGLKPGIHMKLVLDLLRGASPIVKIRTQLSGESPEASKSFQERKKAGTLAPGEKAPRTFRGEKSFTQEGKLTGRCIDPETGEIVVGRPEIVDIKPQSWEPEAK